VGYVDGRCLDALPGRQYLDHDGLEHVGYVDGRCFDALPGRQYLDHGGLVDERDLPAAAEASFAAPLITDTIRRTLPSAASKICSRYDFYL